MDYFFNDHLRWNLGWETPNQGGAFLVTLLPWLWGLTTWLLAWSVTGKRGGGTPPTFWMRVGHWTLLLLAVVCELWLTWTVVKTYSRGALAGLGVAGVVMLGVRALSSLRGNLPKAEFKVECNVPARSVSEKRARDFTLHPLEDRHPRWRGLLLAGGLRLVLLVFCLNVSGGFERVAPEYVGADKSVLNRLDLWHGGLELVAIRPLGGWGWGNAGQSFMNWTQPIGRDEGYKSMVNSYLTVAVEGGLPLFGLALFTGGLVVVAGAGLSIGQARADRGWPGLLALGATGSVVGWAGCIFFSNPWIFPGLWIVPGLSAVLIALLVLLQREARTACFTRPVARMAFGVAGASGLVCLALWATGSISAGRETVNVTVADNTVILAGKSAEASDPGLLVLPDIAVLGDRPGQELRRWVQADATLRLVIPLGKPTAAQIKSARQVVAFGAACGNPDLNGAKVIFVHPYETPPASATLAKGSILMLPGIDLARQNNAWRDWAGTQPALEVKEDAGTALDIRVRWPDVMLPEGKP